MKKALYVIIFLLLGFPSALGSIIFQEHFDDMNTSEEIADNNVHYILPDYRGYFQKISSISNTTIQTSTNAIDSTIALKHYFGLGIDVKAFVYRKDNIDLILGNANEISLDGRIANTDATLNLYFDDNILTFSLMNDFGFTEVWSRNVVNIPSEYSNLTLRNISIYFNHSGINTFTTEIDNLLIIQDCDWNETEVRNCDVTTNVTITGEHYIANISLQDNVYVNLNSAILRYNDSWGYIRNAFGENRMFEISGNSVTIDGNDNSVIKGKYGNGDECSDNHGTTAISSGNLIKRNYPVVKNIKFEENLADFRFRNAVYGRIENNIINHTSGCHPAIWETGNHTNLTNNDWKGNIEVAGGETNIIGNRLLDVVDDDCDWQNHFRITNSAGLWYGKVTDNDFGIDCFGSKNFFIDSYSGDGINISNNKNFAYDAWDIPSTGKEFIYNNTHIYFYLKVKPEDTPTLCVDGVTNQYEQMGIYHEGNWKMSDLVCAGDTEIKHFALTIQTSNVSLNCDGVALNNRDDNYGYPFQIWGTSDENYGSGARDNVSVENCKFWNWYGPAMTIQVQNSFNITNIRLKDIETESSNDAIYLWGVNGLYVDNFTAKDCGAGFSVYEGIEFGVPDTITNNVFINNSNFTGGGCKGFGSTFQGLNSGLTIENSVFDTREAEVNTLSAFDTTGVNIHNNKFLGRSTALNALSGVFYDNIVDDLMIGVSNNLDICNGGIGNTLQQLSIWNVEGVNVLLDSACNPLIIPNGISIRNYDPINSSILFNGNGVTLTGNGNVGINVSGYDADIMIVNSVIENINVKYYSIPVLFNEFTRENTFKDSTICNETTIIDNGINNTINNITSVQCIVPTCYRDWIPTYTGCTEGWKKYVTYDDFVGSINCITNLQPKPEAGYVQCSIYDMGGACPDGSTDVNSCEMLDQAGTGIGLFSFKTNIGLRDIFVSLIMIGGISLLIWGFVTLITNAINATQFKKR